VPKVNSIQDLPGAFLGSMGETAQDWKDVAGETLSEGPGTIKAGLEAGNPLQVAGGALQTALSPVSAIGKVTTEPGFGALSRTLTQGNPLSTTRQGIEAFQQMPLGLQMLSYLASPTGEVGSLAKTPVIAEEAGLPIARMIEQGAMSKRIGLSLENPLSQIETAYAKFNPANLAMSGAGKLMDKLIHMTPLGKGMYVADRQNAVLKAFGKLLNNAGVDMTPDDFMGHLTMLQKAKPNSDEAKTAAVHMQDAEEKITQYVRGETPGVEPVPLGPQGADLGLQAAAQGAPSGTALPPPSRIIHITEDEWASNVKKALKSSGDQTSYILTNSGQRYAVSPIPPGGSLRTRIFNGGEVRTQSGESVPLSEVVQVQGPQGQEVATLPPYAAIVKPPAKNQPVPPLHDLPSAREQGLIDQAHASDWIKGIIGDLKAAPISGNLSQRLTSMGIDPNQLTNALKVRAGVQGQVSKLQNAQVQALDEIASQYPNLIVNSPKDVLGNKFLDTIQSAKEPLDQLRNAIQQGKSFLEGGDLSNLNEEGLNAAIEKGFSDTYQKSFAKNTEQSSIGKWAQRTLGPASGIIGNSIMAAQAGIPLPLALALGGGSALAQATPVGRALAQSLKQSKRLMPGWTSMMQSDEGLRALLNGTAPLLTPGTILSKATKWGDVGPQAEEVLANHGANANFNPFSKSMEDALGAIQMGPLTHEGQVQSEIALGQRGLGKLGGYINRLAGGRLGGIEDYMSRGETAANRMMANQDMLMRASSAIQGKEEVMNRVAPHFAEAVQSLSPSAAEEIANTGGAVSQKRLATLLDQDGVTGDAREQVLSRWQKLLDTGTERGIDLAEKIHYNYRYGNSVDQFMNQFLLNHTWASRNLRYYPQMLAEHPWSLGMMGDWLDTLDQRRQDANGTLRFLGMIPGDGPLEKVLGVLGGHEGQGWTDSTGNVSIAQQLLPLWKAATHPRNGQSFGDTLLDSAGGLSLGMQPLSQMGLQAAGAVGERSYSPIFAAANAPINLAQAHGILPMANGQPTNLDPMSALANWIGEHAPMGHGWEPNTTSRLIQQEVENLAIERGLSPNSPTAKMAANDPNSPLWQEAARRVAGNKGTQQLGRVLGTPEVEFQAPGEQTTQRMAGDPLWQPDLKDPIQQAMFFPQTMGDEKTTKMVQNFLDLQKTAYNQQRINSAAGSPAVVELLARASNNNDAIGQLLDQQGLSVLSGGNNPTIVDKQGQPISPELARQIFLQSQQTIPEFTRAGQTVRETANVNPALRRPMVNAPDQATMQIIRAWDSGDPALRAKILADPQARAVIAATKGVTP
jgi:hypothetical protein